MLRTFRISAALLLCLLLAAAPVHGCCDDFWSCAEAVATSGLSCVVEGAILVVRAVITDLNTGRADHEKTFKDAVTGMQSDAAEQGRKSRDEAGRALQDTENVLAEARKIVGNDLAFLSAKSSVAAALNPPTPTPAPRSGAVSRVGGGALSVFTPTPAPVHGAVQSKSSGETAAIVVSIVVSEAHDVLQDMEKQIADLEACAREARRQAVEKEDAAQGKEVASAEQAARAFKSAFLDKLDKLLKDLQDAVSDVTKIVSFAAHAAGDLKDLIDSYDKVVPPILNQADGVMQAAAGLVQPFASKARSCADQAAAILAKMRRAAQLRTALERKAVQVSIPGLPRTPTPSALGRLRSSPRITAFMTESNQLMEKLRAARARLQSLPGGPGAAELNAFAKRVSTDLDAMFNGKSPADRSRQKGDLLSEAQRRYASDAKTLQAVRKFITDQARARGVN